MPYIFYSSTARSGIMRILIDILGTSYLVV